MGPRTVRFLENTHDEMPAGYEIYEHLSNSCDRFVLQIPGMAIAPRDAEGIQMIKQRDGEAAGGVEQVLEFDALQTAFLPHELDQHVTGGIDGLAMKQDVPFDAYEPLMFQQDLQ